MPNCVTFDWIAIPAGDCWIGSDPSQAAPPRSDEFPLHLVDLPAYSLAKVPVTNRHYARFVADTGRAAPGHWGSDAPPESIEHAPVTYVSWQDAADYCSWSGGRLPTEAEWEKAARGPAGHLDILTAKPRLWPWGDALPDQTRAHCDEQRRGIAPGLQGPHQVGILPEGSGPWGHLDLAGNVQEWTSSVFRAYPWQSAESSSSDGREPVVVRGGSYNHDWGGIRSAARSPMYPAARDVYIGFRVAATPGIGNLGDIEMIDVPAGPFWMGSKPVERTSLVFADELPRHMVALRHYQISRTPVTNAQYAAFVDDTGYAAPVHWHGRLVPDGKNDHPVTWVDWNDATAFCRWAEVRLPTEAEWERAASGFECRIYPWGDDAPECGSVVWNSAGTVAVDSMPRGATPDGIMHMAGNVWEWVQSRYASYPILPGDERDTMEPPGRRVLRGGSFQTSSAGLLRVAARSLSYQTRRREHIGFRVARSGEE